MYVAILFVILLVIAFLAFFEDKEMQEHRWLLFTVATILTLYVAFRPAGIDNDYNSYLGYFRSPTGVAALLTEPSFKINNGDFIKSNDLSFKIKSNKNQTIIPF